MQNFHLQNKMEILQYIQNKRFHNIKMEISVSDRNFHLYVVKKQSPQNTLKALPDIFSPILFVSLCSFV